MLTIELSSLERTHLFGQSLARLLAPCGQNPHGAPPAVSCLLLHGNLGSGKTTLVRSLVQALPGGHEAEVSSPSFTLCNVYATTPPIVHCDLYRSEHSLPDEVWDALDDTRTLTLVEWAEFMPAAALPQEYLDIRLKTCEAHRLATVEPHGAKAQAVVLALQHEDWMTR